MERQLNHFSFLFLSLSDENIHKYFELLMADIRNVDDYHLLGDDTVWLL
jgi:hypothetical protein